LNRLYEYYDPISTLPAEGQAWWREHSGQAVFDSIAAQRSRDNAAALVR